MTRFPDINEFRKGIREFRFHEKRNAMYKVATRIINDYWGNHHDVTDGLGVLLLTWNQALYRYGSFDFEKLEKVLLRRSDEINAFRNREILSFLEKDTKTIITLFNELMAALISIGKDGKLRKSPVAVAKALHLLAPNFFPLWDVAIAKAYGCYWYVPENAAEKYIIFYKKMLYFYGYLTDNGVKNESDVTLLKSIDEYNYSKFTQGWI